MKKQIPVILSALFALTGLIDSTLIHLKEIASLTDKTAFASCSLSGLINCETVAKSPYSHLFGMPVSLLGIFFYVAVLTACVAFLTGWRPPRFIFWGMTLLIMGSFFFSLYLFIMSYFQIHALCPYCLVSDGATLGVLIAWFPFAWPHLNAKES